ncbi:MAG TPA: transporter, partial [Rubrivivax sp.]|nr:transporter [Rubrivivax sp.]
VAAAESGLAQAEAGLAAAQQHLRALAGRAPVASDAVSATEALPTAASGEIDAHAALQELKDRATVAERTAAL